MPSQGKASAFLITAQALLTEQLPQNNRVGNVCLSTNLLSQDTMPYPPERRRRARLKLAQVVRVRPSDAHLHFDEILPTLNTTRDSVYFASKNTSYREGMRVFITFPYSDAPGSLNRESLGQVLRVDDLGQGRRGVAIQILMPLYVGGKETVR